MAKKFNIIRVTIYTTFSRVNTRINGQLKSRFSRLKIAINREERIILRLTRINLK